MKAVAQGGSDASAVRQVRAFKFLGGSLKARVPPSFEKTAPPIVNPVKLDSPAPAQEGVLAMEVSEAQTTNVVSMPKFLTPAEIDDVSALGSGLLQQIKGAELRYDAGMFSKRTDEQAKFIETNPHFERKFPSLAAQVQSSVRRAACAEKLLTDCGVEVRSYDRSNAWHVAHLHANAVLERALPALVAKMHDAVCKADREEQWGLLDQPYHIRCAEYHRQLAPSGGLPDTRHYDDKSLVTMDVLLSDGFHEGGAFCTLESDGRLATHEFQEAGDAKIFVSHKYHCVMPVTKGQRRVLVVEFWRGPARQCPHRCDKPNSDCLYEANFMARPCTHQGVHMWCHNRPCQLTCATDRQYIEY